MPGLVTPLNVVDLLGFSKPAEEMEKLFSKLSNSNTWIHRSDWWSFIWPLHAVTSRCPLTCFKRFADFQNGLQKWLKN